MLIDQCQKLFGIDFGNLGSFYFAEDEDFSFFRGFELAGTHSIIGDGMAQGRNGLFQVFSEIVCSSKDDDVLYATTEIKVIVVKKTHVTRSLANQWTIGSYHLALRIMGVFWILPIAFRYRFSDEP